MIKKATIILIILFIGCSPKSDLPISSSRIKNLKTFSKIYGYVKYFHPSDEAFTLDWDKFSIYAVDKVLKSETNEGFLKTIDSLFSPIAPSIRFSDSADDNLLRKNATYSDNLHEQFWFHQGVGFGMSLENGPYYSQRIIANAENDTISYRPKFGEILQVTMHGNQILSIPLVVHVNETGTIPKSNNKKLESLSTNLNNYKIDERSIAFRLGNIINTHNVFQHFFPYFDVLKLDWEKQLEIALNRSFSDFTLKDHLTTLRKMTAPLKDGHIAIETKGINEGHYTPAFYWEWVDNKLIVTHVWSDDIGLNIGDEIIKINGVTSSAYIDEIGSMISAGTLGRLNYKAEEISIKGEKDSKFTIETSSKTI
ncbi:hypothetical protein [Pareuzebyella sediminis]|nr:hypothetical protein [Pareuzebyella sediminis]